MITLLTRDASKVGNAILYGGNGELDQLHVETDFGNHMTLSSDEVGQMFYIGRLMTHMEWREARRRLTDPNRTITTS